MNPKTNIQHLENVEKRILQRSSDLVAVAEDVAAAVPTLDPPQSVDTTATPDGTGTIESKASDDTDELWVQCSNKKCEEWGMVPQGTFLTYNKRDVKFFCSFVGGKCHLTKRRHTT